MEKTTSKLIRHVALVNSARLGLAMFLWLLAVVASAHDLELSGIRIIRGRSVSVAVHRSRLESREGRALSLVDADLAIRRRLNLRIGGTDFKPTDSKVSQSEDLLTWQAETPSRDGFEVQGRLFPEDASSRTVVTVLDGDRVVEEAVLDAAHPSWPQGSKVGAATAFWWQGVQHILSGADHVMFVLGLILLGGGLKSLLKTVTAFTIAHSVTLSLAVCRVVNPPSRIVEPLIALSIVAIAVENLRAKPSDDAPKRDFRPYVAFAFGLVHGFGFAGALTELSLPRTELATALAMFNVGVECGQAAIILIAAPIIAWLAAHRAALWNRLALIGSATIGLFGGYWFVDRLVR